MELDTIGKRIKKIRKDTDLNQEQFAEKLEISRSVLSQIEIGKIKPSIQMVKEIARIFCINYTWLLDGKGTQVDMKRKHGADQVKVSDPEGYYNIDMITLKSEVGRLQDIVESLKTTIESQQLTINSQQKVIKMLEEKNT